MTSRPRFRQPAAMLAALGLLAAPAAGPTASPQTTVTQQQRDSKQGAVPVASVPAPVIATSRHSFLGFGVRHPVWVGRAKQGKGRNSGNRSKWDYRR